MTRSPVQAPAAKQQFLLHIIYREGVTNVSI